MKASTLFLSVALAGLSIAYCSLYIDRLNLQNEISQLRASNNLPEISASTEIRSSITPAIASTNVANQISTTHSTTQPIASAAFQFQEENLKKLVNQKHAVLFSTVKVSEQDLETMRELLLQRERILNSNGASYFNSGTEDNANSDNLKILVEKIDEQISALLKADDKKKYELLKDSSHEQYQINKFYNEISSKQALSEDKRNTLLLSKLQQKNAFFTLLDTSSEEINNAAPSDRKVLAERFKDNLKMYSDSYLRTAKENLNDEQFSALREYEQKQFEEVWQGIINGWTHD